MEDLGGFLVRRRGLAGGRGELGETIGDEEDEVDEETVRGACRYISELSIATPA